MTLKRQLVCTLLSIVLLSSLLFVASAPRTCHYSTTIAMSKTIYLIRHAESEENRKLASFGRCFKSLGKFSLPSSTDAKLAAQFLNIPAQLDSAVSVDGLAQIDQVAEALKADNFLEQVGVQLVAHSPLQRAKQTSEGMIGCAAPDTKDPSVGRVVELDLLLEKTPMEWVPGNTKSLAVRIQKLEAWLVDQSESTIALVGHSQFFKAMLGMSFKLGNCDVWKVTLDPTKVSTEVLLETTDMTPEASDDDEHVNTLPRGWSDLKRLYVGVPAMRVDKEAETDDNE